jgi:hypothetical protein
MATKESITLPRGAQVGIGLAGVALLAVFCIIAATVTGVGVPNGSAVLGGLFGLAIAASFGIAVHTIIRELR